MTGVEVGDAVVVRDVVAQAPELRGRVGRVLVVKRYGTGARLYVSLDGYDEPWWLRTSEVNRLAVTSA